MLCNAAKRRSAALPGMELFTLIDMVPLIASFKMGVSFSKLGRTLNSVMLGERSRSDFEFQKTVITVMTMTSRNIFK